MRLKFTRKALDGLAAARAGVEYHYDADCKGLAISVGKSGRKSFLIYRKVDGKPVRISLGPYPDLPLEEARRRTAEFNGRVARGDSIQPATRDRVTFRTGFRRFYDEYARVHKVTHLEDQAHFDRHIAKGAGKHFVDKRLDQISRTDIRQMHLQLGEAGKRTTANRILALVSSVFNRLKRWGEFDHPNPCVGIDKYPERSRERFVQPGSEMARLLRALDAENNYANRDFFLVCLLTGARRGNVLAMRWNEVDLNMSTWIIPRTKNGDSQLVHLSTAAAEILESRRLTWLAEGALSEYVFPGKGRTGHLIEPKKAWERVLCRATALGLVEMLEKTAGPTATELGVLREHALLSPSTFLAKHAAGSGLNLSSVEMRDLHIHDLRRTLGSFLASQGVSLTIIGKALNHRTPAATQIYARLWPAAVRDAVQGAGDEMLRRPHA